MGKEKYLGAGTSYDIGSETWAGISTSLTTDTLTQAQMRVMALINALGMTYRKCRNKHKEY